MLILYLLVAVLLTGSLVLSFYPAFGGRQTNEKKARFRRSPQFQQGKFVNGVPTSMDMNMSAMISLLKDYAKGNPNRKPTMGMPMEAVSFESKSKFKSLDARVTWFGHSAFLLEIDGKSILFDPMLGQAPSPFPVFNRRYSGKLPFEIEDLPNIDAVILSHDHYDHLDYGSIMKLKGKVQHYFVPLGVGSHLERWGISSEKISEHDWWDELSFEGLEFVCAPARHFSGRSLTDRNATLWCSWIVKGKESKVYFSGDGGYGPHFKEIGEKYGPFDITLIECGQYDERWAAIHMLPEESVQAHVDVKGALMIPVHWGAFTLSLHDWNDPVERAVRAAEERGVAIATPRIGEPVVVGCEHDSSLKWWGGSEECTQ